MRQVLLSGELDAPASGLPLRTEERLASSKAEYLPYAPWGISHQLSIHTNEYGVFRVDHLFPDATYELTIFCEGEEYVHTVTLGADPEPISLHINQAP